MIKVVCSGPDHVDQISVWFLSSGPKCGLCSLFTVTPPRSDQASGSCAPKLNHCVFLFSSSLSFFFMIKSVNQKRTFAICRSATVNNYGWLISICLRRRVLPCVVRSLQKENKSRMMFFPPTESRRDVRELCFSLLSQVWKTYFGTMF